MPLTSPIAATGPAVVRYEPRGAAGDLFRCRDGEVCISGPAGTGKSLAALYRLHLSALANPRIRCLIVRKTGVSLSSTTLVSFEQKVAGEAIAAGVVRWFGGSPREAAGYRYANGSKINVGGLDNPDKVMSSEYDLIFVDEATEISEDDWEKLGTRLRNFRLAWQQQIAACNPAGPQHWLKQRADRGEMRMLVSRHRDNPEYYTRDGQLTPRGRGYIDGKLGKLTGVRRLRLLQGVWAAAEGVIYEEWDPTVHVIPRFRVPDSWTRYLSVDFGFVNPFAVGWWAEDHDGRLFMFREHYMTGRLVEDHAADILATCTRLDPDYRHPEGRPRYAYHGRVWTEPRPRMVICDHDAEDRATLERHLGMSTVPAWKTVKDGIEAVKARLRDAGDGRARLFAFEDCLVERDVALVEAKRPASVLEEVGGYVWAPGRDGKPLKEEPVKLDDHGLDQLRYMCATLDLAPRPRVRMM